MSRSMVACNIGNLSTFNEKTVISSRRFHLGQGHSFRGQSEGHFRYKSV